MVARFAKDKGVAKDFAGGQAGGAFLDFAPDGFAAGFGVGEDGVPGWGLGVGGVWG